MAISTYEYITCMYHDHLTSQANPTDWPTEAAKQSVSQSAGCRARDRGAQHRSAIALRLPEGGALLAGVMRSEGLDG